MPSLAYSYGPGVLTLIPTPNSGEAISVDRELAILLDRIIDRSYSLTTNYTRFLNLVNTWQHETQFAPSVYEMVLSPSYQQVIGLGQEAIPWILKELERNPDHWFWALKSITGVDPVKSSNQGNIKEMANDWLEWGKENGHV